VQMDLQFTPFCAWQEIEKYCYLDVSTVGLLSMPVLGQAPGISFERSAPFAIKLGIALQLTNILREWAKMLPVAGSTFRWLIWPCLD